MEVDRECFPDNCHLSSLSRQQPCTPTAPSMGCATSEIGVQRRSASVPWDPVATSGTPRAHPSVTHAFPSPKARPRAAPSAETPPSTQNGRGVANESGTVRCFGIDRVYPPTSTSCDPRRAEPCSERLLIRNRIEAEQNGAQREAQLWLDLHLYNVTSLSQMMLHTIG